MAAKPDLHVSGILTVFVICVFCQLGTYGQILLTGCPEGWVNQLQTCYKFVRDKPLIYDEADAACWTEGATLLSVNDWKEHQFITVWLQKHDSAFQSVWFTSGYYGNGQLAWEGDNTASAAELDSYWYNRRLPDPNSPYSRVAYVSGGQYYEGYGWDLVAGSAPSKYICEMKKRDVPSRRIIERGIDYGSFEKDENEIPTGPEMIAEPEGVVVFNKESTVIMECAAIGNPFPHFRWWRNVNESIEPNTNQRYTLSGSRFTIQNPFEEDDHGSYQCESYNEFGSILSQPAQIIFGSLQEFSNVRPEHVVANKFEGTRISCLAPRYYPAARFEWFQWTTNEFIFEEHNYMFVSDSGYLYFSEVQPTDERTYYCIVTLTAPEIYATADDQPPSRTSMGTDLYVVGFERGVYAPFIYDHAFPSPAVRGSTVRLECVAYGSLPLRYSWRRKDGRPFSSRVKIFDNSRVLTISDAQLTDEGDYLCTCNGRGGDAEKVITVVLEARPYFPFAIRNKFVDPGQEVKWRCKAVGRPHPTYSWYKNGKPVVEVPGQIEVRGNLLHIQSVDADRDQGMYQCAATNYRGTSFSGGQLKVMYFAPTFARHPLPPVTLAPIGGNITIPCRVEAAPIPDIQWVKNGGDLGLQRGVMSGTAGMTSDGDLLLTDITYSDRGNYACKAFNEVGEASSQTVVTTIRGVEIIQPPVATKAMVNTSAFLYCQAAFDGNFDISYVWKFNGHRIDFKHTRHFVRSRNNNFDGMYIIDPQFHHTGLYECEAKTTLHSIAREAMFTVIGPPGMPAGVYTESTKTTANSAVLIWTKGREIDHGGAIISYDIEAESHYHPDVWKVVARDVQENIAASDALADGHRPDQRTTTVHTLIPNTGYRFRVRATNQYGKGEEASLPSVTIKTPASVPVVAPRNVGGGGGKVGTIKITWTALDIAEECGSGIGYNVYWRLKSLGEVDFKKAVLHGRHNNYSHTVGADYYYLEYDVRVGVFNDMGPGVNSTVNTIFSAEGIPIGVPIMGDCENYNGTAIYVEWTPVEDTREVMKGRVRGYTVQYHHIDEPDFLWTREIYGQQDNTIIIGLVDNSNYWVRVQVFNTAARGPVGEWRLGETFHLPPRHYPRHVRVYSHGPSSVRVTWQGISTRFDEETLQGYKVRVWKIQEDIRTANDTEVEKVSEAVVYGLQQRTVYVLRVLGFSIGGDGAMSNHIYFTVDAGSVPFDPATTDYCFDQSPAACDATTPRATTYLTLGLLAISLALCLL